MKPLPPDRKDTPAATHRERALHFVTSFACNLSCGHCIYRCGPARAQTMQRARAEGYIEQAAQAGVRHIVFNGGEPFVYFPLLRALVGKARELGVRSTVVTNGSWAVSLRKALEDLALLKDAGLDSMTISTDRYHLALVPEKRICTALEAGGRLGVRTGVKIARLPWDPVAEGLFRSLRRLTSRIIVQQVSPLGRAYALREALPLRPVFHLSRPGCMTPPVLLPGGDLLTCCNLPACDMPPEASPFMLGNMNRVPLERLLKRRRHDPLLGFLQREGPRDLYVPLLAGAPENAVLPPSYFHSSCDLCYHLFREPWARAAAYGCLASQQSLKRRPGAGSRPRSATLPGGTSATLAG